MMLLLMVPLGFMGLEKTNPPQRELLTVVTTIHIEASADKVWTNLISFPDLPGSENLMFRLGVSHPIRANIDGSGIGALRECTFSTGKFVERIDAWEENRRLG